MVGVNGARNNPGIARSLLEPVRRQRRRRRLMAAALIAVLIAGGAGATLVALGGRGKPPLLVPRPDIGTRDQLAFSAGQKRTLERAAAFGFADVLYTKSPGGVLVAAERTAGFRPLVKQAAAGTGIDAAQGPQELLLGTRPARSTRAYQER